MTVIYTTTTPTPAEVRDIKLLWSGSWVAPDMSTMVIPQPPRPRELWSVDYEAGFDAGFDRGSDTGGWSAVFDILRRAMHKDCTEAIADHIAARERLRIHAETHGGRARRKPTPPPPPDPSRNPGRWRE